MRPFPGWSWAGTGLRLGALLIDGVVIYASLLLAAGLSSALGADLAASDWFKGVAMALFSMWGVFAACYMPLFWWTLQGTIGQRLLGLRVLGIDGHELSLQAAVLRYGVWLVCAATLVLALAGALAAGKDPARRMWWDETAGSVVVRRN